MEKKKWPVLASIIIALGVIGSVLSIFNGILERHVVEVISGLVGLVVYWNVDKFKTWALRALIVLMALNILLVVFQIVNGMPIVNGAFLIVIFVLIICYFNSSRIRGLFDI